MTTPEKLQAWMELSEAKARYCRYLDTKDWEALADLMLEELEMDVSGSAPGMPVIQGRDKALAMVRGSIGEATTAHQVHNLELTLRGDEADVIWAMQDRVLWGPEKPSLVGYGHYHETWVRRDGEWKMAKQRLTRLHMDFAPPAQPADKSAG